MLKSIFVKRVIIVDIVFGKDIDLFFVFGIVIVKGVFLGDLFELFVGIDVDGELFMDV